MKYEGPWWFPHGNTPTALKKTRRSTLMSCSCLSKPMANAPIVAGQKVWLSLPTLRSTLPGNFPSLPQAKKDRSLLQKTGRIPNNYALVDSFWAPMVQKNHGLTNTKAFLTAFEKGEADVISGMPRSQYWNEVVKPVGWDPLIAGSCLWLPMCCHWWTQACRRFWTSIRPVSK